MFFPGLDVVTNSSPNVLRCGVWILTKVVMIFLRDRCRYKLIYREFVYFLSIDDLCDLSVTICFKWWRFLKYALFHATFWHCKIFLKQDEASYITISRKKKRTFNTSVSLFLMRVLHIFILLFSEIDGVTW